MRFKKTAMRLCLLFTFVAAVFSANTTKTLPTTTTDTAAAAAATTTAAAAATVKLNDTVNAAASHHLKFNSNSASADKEGGL